MGATNKYDVFAIVFVFILAIVLERQEAFSLVEDESLSYRQLLRTYYAEETITRPSDDIVIVYTDEEFYAEYDMFPLRRVDLATIVDRLSQMGAKVIAVDMLLDFKSAYGEDPTLVDALSEAGNVQLVSQAQLENDRFVKLNKAIPRFESVTTSGYSNYSSNSAISESIVRLRIYNEVNDKVGEWPFPIQVVGSFLEAEIKLNNGVLAIGDLEIRLDQFNDLYIDYPLLPSDGQGGVAKLHDVVGLSALDILFVEDEEELEDLAYLIEGRIVLVGEVAEVAHDVFETPVGNVYGVEIIANTIATILKGGPLRAASFGVEILVALIMMMLLITTRSITNPLPRNLVSLALLIVYIFGAGLVYVFWGLVLSMSYVLMAAIFAILWITGSFYLAEMGQKAQIREMFGQYLSPTVVADLVMDPEKLSLGGEEREMTAYFSDIAGFSSFSEHLSAPELVLVLNDYLTEMCNIIIGGQGTIDKFEGDAIIAFWGAPAIQEGHARLACLASIDMNKTLIQLREKWAQQSRPEINVRMGLNSGSMVVGNMGSAQRMDYTMMGDSVNLASRLEGANKAYGSDVMISEATYLAAAEHVDVRELDTIRVVGKNEPVKVYQLLDRKGQTPALMSDLVSQFNKGLEFYKDGDFAVARQAFESSLKIAGGHDGPSGVYIERCERFLIKPPARDWDGVFSLDSKG